MAKKRFAFLLSVILLFSTSCALAGEWVCSNCGKTNTTNFCTACGMKHDTWICPNCGTENEDAFCGNCGSARLVDLSALYGTWVCEDSGEKYYLEAHEDGTMIVVSDNELLQVTYEATNDHLTITTPNQTTTTVQYKISNDQLLIDYTPPLTKTNETIVFKVTMDGQSMADTISEGDTLFFEHRDPADFQRFDIAAVNYPGRYGTILIKRIVGLPGDTIELRDGYLFINGEKQEEPYINEEYRSGNINRFGPFTVPEGYYFVLGDHRNNSNDSRSVGSLDANMILGIHIPDPTVP